jgi:predicted ATPase/class 3 adenylate cyclase
MKSLRVYIPMDRRQAMARGQESLPDRAHGVVLFADISGFTPLTEILAQELGPQHGADELTQQLNLVYEALITQVHHYRGSVIGFSGDAITCWFDGDDGLRATTCALAMQQAMTKSATIKTVSGTTVPLAIKVAVTGGPVRRFRVGDPHIQYLDVLAGTVLDRVDDAENQSRKGEIILGAEVISQLQGKIEILEWRQGLEPGQRYAVVAGLADQAEPTPWPTLSSSIHPTSPEGTTAGLTTAHTRSWLLPPVYERISAGRGQFLAELRTVVAVFLRFKGLDYDQDEAAGDKLDAYIRWVQNVLALYEGYLLQLTTGDKGSYLYATFGALLAHGDDAARAVAAALELQSPSRALDFISEVQIGLSQGQMRAGAYGSTRRRTYGVLGREVNVAARLMNKIEPGQILVSERVAQAASKSYHFKPQTPVAIRGLQDPIPVYGISGKRSRVASHRPATLVGREAALTQLEQVLDSVLAGEGQILRLEGVAGVGKSHMAVDFIELAVNRNFQVARGICQKPDQSVAYGPWRQIFRVWFDLTDEPLAGEDRADWVAREIGQVEATISDINPDWLPYLPLLGDLLGLPIPDNAITEEFADPLLRQGVLLAVAAEMIQTWVHDHPSLILIEDAHWMDEATQKITWALAQTLANTPLLLALVHRSSNFQDKLLLPHLDELPYYNHLNLHGKAEPVAVHRASQKQTTAISPKTQGIVGRVTERTTLGNRLQALLDGEAGSLVVIEGEAGIGKSCLVAHLLQQAQALGVTSLIGAGDAIEQSTPYHAWRPIFRQLFNLDARPDANAIAQRTQVLHLLPTNRELLQLVPLLNAVLPLRLRDNEVTRQMAGEVRADNTQKLLTGLLQRTIAESPTLLILENAQWLDSASWALARRLVNEHLQQMLLVLVTRPLADPLPTEYQELLHTSGVQHLHLGPLPPKDITTLLYHRLGVAELPTEVMALIREKAEGHPFFSEELVYALYDTGVLLIADGKCRVSPQIKNLSTITIPDTIEGVITNHIDRLTSAQQLTLKVASVIGRVFDYQLLYDIHPVERDKSRLADYLETLQRLDLIQLESAKPDLTYNFKQVITQEMAYNLLLFARRRELHQAIAVWLERTYAEKLESLYPLLAHHWRKAEVIQKAIDYLEKAGEQALLNYANKEAVEFFSQALTLVEYQPPTVVPRSSTSRMIARPLVSTLRQARWHNRLGEACWALGQIPECREHSELALALLDDSIPDGSGKLLLSLPAQIIQQSLHRLWPKRFIANRARSQEREILLEKALAFSQLGAVYYFANKPLPVIYTILRTLNLAEQAGPSPLLTTAYAEMCLVAGLIPLHSLAEMYSNRADEAAQATDQLSTVFRASNETSFYKISVGQWAKAQEALERTVVMSERLGDWRQWSEGMPNLANLAALVGKMSRSLELFNTLVNEARRRNNPMHQAWGMTGQAFHALCLGQAAQAINLLEEALTLLSNNADLMSEINIYGQLAMAHLQRGQLTKARQAADEVASRIAQSSPIMYTAFFGYFGMAEVYLTLWEQSLQNSHLGEHTDLEKLARQACKSLYTYKRVFPIGQPEAWRDQGWYYWLTGKPGKAHKFWRKSLAAAERLGMPYAQALAHYEIGRHLAADDPGRQEHLMRAQEIFNRLDAVYYLSRVETALTSQ